jgi:hypothetical protein
VASLDRVLGQEDRETGRAGQVGDGTGGAVVHAEDGDVVPLGTHADREVEGVELTATQFQVVQPDEEAHRQFLSAVRLVGKWPAGDR